MCRGQLLLQNHVIKTGLGLRRNKISLDYYQEEPQCTATHI